MNAPMTSAVANTHVRASMSQNTGAAIQSMSEV